MDIRWDPLKSQWLKRVRGVSFEDIMLARYIGREAHPKKTHQDVMFFELGGYIWVAPYVRNGDDIFLKTLFASRSHTKRWKRGELI